MLNVSLGDICELLLPEHASPVVAEVIGFSDSGVLLAPLSEVHGVSRETLVVNTGRELRVPTGVRLLGRMLNGIGELQGSEIGEDGELDQYYPVNADAPRPLDRQLIQEPLATGVCAIDSLLSFGEGQRMGIFAPAGCGKSTLLAMIARGVAADVCVLALIGERGREVREFVEKEIGPELRSKTVLVVATSDRPALERIKAAYVATAVAESFRDQGKKVLLLMDSVTRFARALREIGLAAGEPPARRGFPPSVFAELPKLLERAGNNAIGSISAFYTVLVEGDDMSEPVADEVRSILDGHIVLSREIAERGQYPAIDVLASTSRVMNAIVTPTHQRWATRVRALMAIYQENEFLIKIGEYQAGSDKEIDAAIAKKTKITEFLKQDEDTITSMDDALAQLQELLN